MHIKILVSAVLGAGLTAACATAVPPAPAVLEYARQDCDAAPNLADAISLTPEKESPVHRVSTVVTSQTACLKSDGGTSPYVVYALPADRGDKTLIVGGVLEAFRIFAPAIILLDSQGQVTRAFAADEFLYRGPVYSVQFRPRETEAYILVDVDRDRVGAGYDAINVGTNTTTISTGYYASNWTTGTENHSSRTFSWEGTVLVTVNDSDTEEKPVDPA
ncbi:MAG: hypothetical protein ACI9YM_001999 [Brevundimonas sp.]|jgi:hypothetical protein|uniref:MalM family protein n=1 Tax=Brevundimonas sp. TaxID=1871086 RepID=UPI0039E4FB3A